MKVSTLTLAVTLAAGAACAGEVAPTDVVFNDAGAVEASLSGVAGNPEEGAKVMVNRGQGNCMACHVVSAIDAPFQGNVGPALNGVADRWSEAELRSILVNAKVMFEGTVMPAFYKVDGFTRPGDAYTGKAATEIKPLLTAQQVEDVVAYLLTLKE